jgi:hypothetical protein
MTNPEDLSTRSKWEHQSGIELLAAMGHTSNAKLLFSFSEHEGAQRQSLEANANPFGCPSEKTSEANGPRRIPVESMEGWTFQGRRKQAPTLASPRQGLTQSPLHTPLMEGTPGGKRGLMHSEVLPSFFTSLGISASPNKEPLGARIWPVLTREKNVQRKTLVHSRNQTPPSLLLNIRITGPTCEMEIDWTPNSAWEDLIQCLESELEEKLLRFKLSINERPQLEWVWQEELRRGGMECTILTHINMGLSTLGVQSKRHLHWKALEHIPSMNNEVEFAVLAHNLLRKSAVENTTHLTHKNNTASILASPQASRKKRFTKVDLALLRDPQKGSIGPVKSEALVECGD